MYFTNKIEKIEVLFYYENNWGYPNTVWFGSGRINKLPKACNIFNIKKPLLVTDKDLVKQKSYQKL